MKENITNNEAKPKKINEPCEESNRSEKAADHQLDALAKQNVKSWEIHKRLYNWVLGWAKTKYGLFALILIALVEPICVPIPADVMVLGMGISKPKNAIFYGLTCSFFSAMGGTIALLLGMAIGGENVVNFFEQFHLGPISLGEKTHEALELYRKYDFWAISISALTPVPYMLFSWLGGIANVSIAKFIAVSIVFRSIRFGSEGVLLYFFGAKARELIEKHFNTATVIAMVLLVGVVLLIKFLQG